MNNHVSAAAQVRRLLIVVGSGVVLAVLLALLSLHYYSPTGAYLVKNVLLAPESLASMRFADGSTREGGTPRFIFDAIEFTFYDGALQKWSKRSVSLEQYASFYRLIKNQKSLADVTAEAENAFNQAYQTSLVIKVRQENSSARQALATTVSEVDFANEGGYYRIQLRGQADASGWVYFQQSGIYNQVLELFKLAI